MPYIDPDERETLDAYEAGALKSVATKAELARLRATARATATKGRRVNEYGSAPYLAPAWEPLAM